MPEMHIKRKKIEGKMRVIKETNEIEEPLEDGVYTNFNVKLRPKFYGCLFTLVVKTDENGHQTISIGEQEFTDEQLECIIFCPKE